MDTKRIYKEKSKYKKRGRASKVSQLGQIKQKQTMIELLTICLQKQKAHLMKV